MDDFPKSARTRWGFSLKFDRIAGLTGVWDSRKGAKKIKPMHCVGAHAKTLRRKENIDRIAGLQDLQDH